MNTIYKSALSILIILSLILCIPTEIKASDTDAVPWYITDTGAPDLWAKLESSKPKKDVIVAVIDTGIDYTHPDLKQALWINKTEASGKEGVDDDQNGFIDDIYGINTLNSSITPSSGNPQYDTSPTAYDFFSHGTHVAGIIAQIANITPECNPYRVKIMSIRAGNSRGSFQYEDIVKAINYATTMGADIINLSLGTTTPSKELTTAIEEASKKCVIVAAAGNSEGRRASSTREQDSIVGKNIFPAAYPYAIGVMYHEESHHLSNNSNWDAIANTEFEYEISAPGDEITSTIPDGTYASKSGTSMAAGFVSGSIALILQAQRQFDEKNCSPQKLQSILLASCLSDVIKTEGVIQPLTFRRLQLSDYAKTLPDTAEATVKKPKLTVSRSKNAVKLHWTSDPAVTSYELYRRKGNSGKFQLYKTLSNTKTGFTDKNVSYSTRYSYKLKAIGKTNTKTSSIQKIAIPKKKL